MSIAQITGAVVVAATFAALLLNAGAQSGRNAAAQAAAARTYPIPAFSRQINEQIAARAAAPAAPTQPAAASSVQAAGVTLRAVGFEFPSSDREFAPGPGAELVTNNCTACHSPGMILTQPKLTQAEWTGEVNKMIQTYKAPVDAVDVPAIATFLASLQPTP